MRKKDRRNATATNRLQQLPMTRTVAILTDEIAARVTVPLFGALMAKWQAMEMETYKESGNDE
jgi:hypothetical protein